MVVKKKLRGMHILLEEEDFQYLVLRAKESTSAVQAEMGHDPRSRVAPGAVARRAVREWVQNEKKVRGKLPSSPTPGSGFSVGQAG